MTNISFNSTPIIKDGHLRRLPSTGRNTLWVDRCCIMERRRVRCIQMTLNLAAVALFRWWASQVVHLGDEEKHRHNLMLQILRQTLDAPNQGQAGSLKIWNQR